MVSSLYQYLLPLQFPLETLKHICLSVSYLLLKIIIIIIATSSLSLISTTHMYMSVGPEQPTSNHLSTKMTLPPSQSSTDRRGAAWRTLPPSKPEVWLALHHSSLVWVPIAAVGLWRHSHMISGGQHFTVLLVLFYSFCPPSQNAPWESSTLGHLLSALWSYEPLR